VVMSLILDPVLEPSVPVDFLLREYSYGSIFGNMSDEQCRELEQRKRNHDDEQEVCYLIRMAGL
jgi:hypothetical protein